MKRPISSLLVAIALGGVAAAALAASRIDRQVARAQQQLATLELEAPEATFAELASYLDFAESVPWLFGETRAELSARRVTLRYWRGEYAEILADYGERAVPEVAKNLPLQAILANAAYRASFDPDAEREQILQTLGSAISFYLGVLQQSSDYHDAAYNYEYLVRLRADIASGAEIPSTNPNPHGREGEAPEDSHLEDTKIYVPVQRDVDPEIDESPTLGAGGRIRKRG